MTDDARVRHRGWPLMLGAGAVVFVAVFAVVVGVRNRGTAPAPGYDARSRRAFVTECVNNGGPSYEPVCECAFDRIVETVPYERYLTINDSAARRRSAASVPTSATSTPRTIPGDDEVSNALGGCLGRKIRGSTPATLPDPPTSTPPRTESPATLILNPDASRTTVGSNP